MSDKNNKTRWLIAAAALATLLAAIFAPSPEEGVIAPRRHDTAGRTEGPMPPDLESVKTGLIPLKRGESEDMPGALFSVNLPPPPPPPPKVNLVPVAPPLPYTYAGKMFDGSQLSVFLNREEKPYIIKVGDVLDGMYAVKSISSSRIELVYLPLNQIQVLNIGANP